MKCVPAPLCLAREIGVDTPAKEVEEAALRLAVSSTISSNLWYANASYTHVMACIIWARYLQLSATPGRISQKSQRTVALTRLCDHMQVLSIMHKYLVDVAFNVCTLGVAALP